MTQINTEPCFCSRFCLVKALCSISPLSFARGNKLVKQAEKEIETFQHKHLLWPPVIKYLLQVTQWGIWFCWCVLCLVKHGLRISLTIAVLTQTVRVGKMSSSVSTSHSIKEQTTLTFYVTLRRGLIDFSKATCMCTATFTHSWSLNPFCCWGIQSKQMSGCPTIRDE